MKAFFSIILQSFAVFALLSCATVDRVESGGKYSANDSSSLQGPNDEEFIGSGRNVEWTNQALPVPDSTLITTAEDERIHPYDRLDIIVQDVKSLSGEYQVNQAGDIKMPLIGEVSVSGLTSYDLSNVLENRLGAEYLQDPHVTVLREAVENERITIDGSVNRPGVYPIRGETTLLAALALSGGAKDNANLGRVTVFRTVDGVKKAAAFDANRIRKGESKDIVLYGNDLVVVDGSDIKKGWREILRALPLLIFL